MIRIDASEIFLNADFGALQLRLPRTEPQVTADGILYRRAASFCTRPGRSKSRPDAEAAATPLLLRPR